MLVSIAAQYQILRVVPESSQCSRRSAQPLPSGDEVNDEHIDAGIATAVMAMKSGSQDGMQLTDVEDQLVAANTPCAQRQYQNPDGCQSVQGRC
eukprot:305081-Amphidinium_carterae.1